MPSLNLLDLVKLNGATVEADLIEATGTSAPEVVALPSRTIRGTEYSRVLRTSEPTGAFRAANEGQASVASIFERKLVQCFILSSRCDVDKAVANAYEDGPAALMEIEAQGAMKGALKAIGSQMFYGISANAKGFAGLAATVASTMKVDASASGTQSTGSSVYIIAAGPDGVQFVYGGGNALQMSDWREGDAVDSGGTNRYAAYIADITAWVGLQVVNPFSIAQIFDVTADSGKTLTDSLIAQALEKFPTDVTPTHIIMNRRSRGQLQRSRTVTLFGGAGSRKADGEIIAPIPGEAFGLPIICTDSITNTEAIIS